jgi:prepilin-type processing-associated H-X9-DG protein
MFSPDVDKPTIAHIGLANLAYADGHAKSRRTPVDGTGSPVAYTSQQIRDLYCAYPNEPSTLGTVCSLPRSTD